MIGKFHLKLTEMFIRRQQNISGSYYSRVHGLTKSTKVDARPIDVGRWICFLIVAQNAMHQPCSLSVSAFCIHCPANSCASVVSTVIWLILPKACHIGSVPG